MLKSKSTSKETTPPLRGTPPRRGTCLYSA